MDHFSLLPPRYDGRSDEYHHWRQQRLQKQREHIIKAILLSPSRPNTTEHSQLTHLCTQVREHGFAVYQWTTPSTDPQRDVVALHAALSLHSIDKGVVTEDSGLSLLTDMTGTRQGKFVPYTAKAMGWHTDGYYNTRELSLNCFALHCVAPAQSGGTLTLLDHQLIILALLDEEPDLLHLLAHPEAMMLPANKDDIGHDRPERFSPVIFIRSDGTPGVHFTTRTTHIKWRTPETLAAAQQMKALIEKNPQWHHSIRLEAGQGVITRNVLHRRDAYTDDAKAPRKMLRGRYLQSPHLPPVNH